MKRKKLYFLVSLLVPTFFSLLALDPNKTITQYKLDILQTEQGLEQNTVLAIRQVRDNYIWLGTMNGLLRFDGARFKTFNTDNTKQLHDNIVRIIHEDRKCNLWIGTENGGLTCLKNGTFESFSLEKEPSLKDIQAVFEDREGTLWIGTLDNGLIGFKNKKFIHYTEADGLLSNRIRALYEDEDGRLWIGTDKGLFYRKSSGEFNTNSGQNGKFDKYIISMCKTKDGKLWIGCDTGLYYLKDGTFTYDGSNESLPNLKIKCIYEDSHRNLWIGTEGGGLARIRNGCIETFSTVDGLASGYIRSIYEDNEGNIWIGTHKGGLHKLSNILFTPYTTREGLSDDNVNCVTDDRKGNILIGTKNGLNRLENGKLSLEWTKKKGLLSNNVTAIMEDSNGYIWIGTDTGLNRYKDGKLESFVDPGVDSNYIYRLWEEGSGVIWVLTLKNLKRFYNGKFAEIINRGEVSNSYIVSFFKGRDGSLWIGTNGSGLYRLKDKKLIAYTIREGLLHNAVESIYEDNKGYLYIGTRGGLSILFNGKFINYTTQNGLIDSYIYYIVEDESGYLWMPGRTGISRIEKKQLFDFANGKIEKVNPKLFNESDGIKNAFCNYCIKTRDGKVWFATDKGVAVINPSDIRENMQAPPVVIEELIVDGEALPIREPLTIPPGKKRLEFHYTGLSFVKSQQIKFKIKLEGYDRDWVDMGHARSTNYTSLSPGEYIFKVTACNSDGVWNEEGASISFKLKPYFYEATWFYVLLVLSVLSLGFIGYRLRVRQLKLRQKELTALVKARTREVEDKNRQLEDQSIKLQEMDQIKSRFFANISHEFRTPLTLIMGPLEQMIATCLDNEQEEKRKLNMMLRNAQRLLRLINQLLELSKLDSGKMKLQAIKTDIISFLKGIIDSFRLLAYQNDLDLSFQAEGMEEIFLYLDPRKMEDVMANLLVNAFKFTPVGGKITVIIEQNSLVEISVCDTGLGIPEKELPYIFDRFFQAESTYELHQKGTGIGLALAKELVELHHGTIEAKSREGEGCTFIVRLPMGRDHLSADQIVELSPSLTPAHDITSAEIPPSETETDRKQETVGKKGKKERTAPWALVNLEAVIGRDDTDIILVVEDSADMCDYIRGALEPVYTVVDAKDGREGIEKAQEIIPDLIISDIMMPEMNGYELCRTLKNDVKTSHIPIILLTAKAAEDNIIQGLECGADDYITKPFNTNILIARIKNLIDIRSQLQKSVTHEMPTEPVKTSISSIDREFLKELHEAIQKNLDDEDFNVEKLCKILYMGRTTLYRKVLALTGETPTDFIRSYRLKKGAELLKQNSTTVLEVAMAVGFSNSSYFAKCFKEKFHQLPSEYQTTGK